MKYLKQVCLVLLILTMIWCVLWFLPDLGVAVARLIYHNPLTNALQSAYDSFFTPLLCMLFAFCNLLYAAADLVVKHGAKQEIRHLDRVFAVISAMALLLHGCGFYAIFEILRAG